VSSQDWFAPKRSLLIKRMIPSYMDVVLLFKSIKHKTLSLNQCGLGKPKPNPIAN